MISTSFSPRDAEMTEMQERPMSGSIGRVIADLNGGNSSAPGMNLRRASRVEGRELGKERVRGFDGLGVTSSSCLSITLFSLDLCYSIQRAHCSSPPSCLLLDPLCQPCDGPPANPYPCPHMVDRKFSRPGSSSGCLARGVACQAHHGATRRGNIGINYYLIIFLSS
jgi:hypothetical protein